MNFWLKICKSLFFERNIMVLSLTVLFIIIAFFSWYPILPIFLQELGASDFQIGFAYTLLAFSYSLMQFWGGILSDHFGRKLLITLPTFFLPLLYFLAGNSSDWKLVVFYLVLSQVCSALQLPSFYSIIAESVPKNKRGTAYSIFELFVVLGITLGPLLGMILIPKISIKYLFYLTSLVTFLCALARVLWLRETYHQRIKINKEESKRALFNQHIMIIIIALSSLIFLFNLTGNGPFISLYVKEVMNLDKAYINLLFTSGGLAAVIFSLWGGKFIDKWGSKKVLSISALGMGLFIILWSFSFSLHLNILCFVLFYTFFQSCYIAYGALMADITHQASRGLIIGFIGTTTGLIGSLGSVLGGYLKVHFVPASPFWAGVFFAILTSVLLVKIKE